MSVHKAISKHVNKQNQIITEFVRLDNEREFYIEQALENCREGKPFSADKINEVTATINELSKHSFIPARKYVTLDMIKEYADRMH